MVNGVVIAQVLLTLVVGLWLGSKFGDSPFVKFFGRNDWFVGAFLALVGYINYSIYSVQYVKNLNLVLVVFGLLMILFSLADSRKK